MPKMKTRKSAAKRIKRTGSGKFKAFRAGRRHLMSKKSGRKRRRLAKPFILKGTEKRRVQTALPYDLK